jgi:sulfonate transport system permease protein
MTDSIGVIPADVGASAARWLLGWASAIVAGAGICAVYLAMGRILRRGTSIAMNFLRAIPILAIAPLVLAYAGPDEPSKVFIIFWACLFPILLRALGEVEAVEEDEKLFISGLGVTSSRRRWLMYSRRLLLGVLHGGYIAIGVGWISVVAAEYLGIYSDALLNGGMGYRIDLYYKESDWAGLWLYVLLFGAVGFSTALLYRFAVGTLLRGAGIRRVLD